MEVSVFHELPWWDDMRQFVGQRAPFLSWSQPDTLLNVFLAIAVDNLANAQELTKVCKTPPAAKKVLQSLGLDTFYSG